MCFFYPSFIEAPKIAKIWLREMYPRYKIEDPSSTPSPRQRVLSSAIYIKAYNFRTVHRAGDIKSVRICFHVLCVFEDVIEISKCY